VLSAMLLSAVLASDTSASVRGQYVEARTCDVFTGECFANADTGLTGKNAVVAWKIDSGTVDGVKLDGLGIVAVLATTDTLGLKQSAPGRSVLIVDEKATKAQRDALIAFAKAQAGKLLGEVVAVRDAKVDLEICDCAGESCATLKAGTAKIKTRCIDTAHDKACGNEAAIYRPLSKGVTAHAAVATEHSFTGKELNETWHDGGRRGAYVGSFVAR
jgi:hypothetical protein